MIHNKIGTFVAMTHILFALHDSASLFRNENDTLFVYARCTRRSAHRRSLALSRSICPSTVPGIGAGCILVFILSIGYYITPALVGGRTGTFISNIIALHISETLNDWGLAAALGVILLALVLLALFPL